MPRGQTFLSLSFAMLSSLLLSGQIITPELASDKIKIFSPGVEKLGSRTIDFEVSRTEIQ